MTCWKEMASQWNHLCARGTSLIGYCYFFLACDWLCHSEPSNAFSFFFLDWMVSFLVMSKINDFVANVIVGAYGTVLLSYKAYFNVNCDSKLRGIVKRNLLRLMALFWGQVYLPPPPPREKRKKTFFLIDLFLEVTKTLLKWPGSLCQKGEAIALNLQVILSLMVLMILLLYSIFLSRACAIFKLVEKQLFKMSEKRCLTAKVCHFKGMNKMKLW